MDETSIRRYQLRELVKKLTLLEGHLANFTSEVGGVLCCHCSAKHAFELEALAEEGVSVLNDLAPQMRALAAWARANEEVFRRCQLEESVVNRLIGEARGFRKALMAALERVPAPAMAQSASSGAATGAGSSPPLHLLAHAGRHPDNGRG
jgi:hypothetical protein